VLEFGVGYTESPNALTLFESLISLCVHLFLVQVCCLRISRTESYYVRFQVLTAASMMFRIVFWDVLPDDGGSTHL
jgi:hypothetical protein